jgi:hypothetical protein
MIKIESNKPGLSNNTRVNNSPDSIMLLPTVSLHKFTNPDGEKLTPGAIAPRHTASETITTMAGQPFPFSSCP